MVLNQQDKQYRSLLLLRNSCLGEDRLGRKYWRLQAREGEREGGREMLIHD